MIEILAAEDPDFQDCQTLADVAETVLDILDAPSTLGPVVVDDGDDIYSARVIVELVPLQDLTAEEYTALVDRGIINEDEV